MDAAWCIREADDDLAFNEYFHIDPFTIIKIHFSKLLPIISSILNLRYAMRQQNLDMSL
jgi:flagellar biosynthesis component FlhA